MTTDNILFSHSLANGLEIVFREHGNRYFGDYHQVKMTVSCRIDLEESLASGILTKDDLEKARQLFGDHVEYTRLVKQMGVAGAEVESVRQQMIDNFIAHSASYMAGDDFAARFVLRKLTERRNRNRLHLAGYD